MKVPSSITGSFKEKTSRPFTLAVLLVILFQHCQLMECRAVCYKKYDLRRGTCTKGKMKGQPADISYKTCCTMEGAKAWKPNAKANACIKCINIVDGSWSPWSKFTACSAKCDYGKTSRERKCDNPKPKHGGEECVGFKKETTKCYSGKRCPVDGFWSNWSNWSPCSVSCLKGITLRSRSCSSPRPQFGGKDCAGVSEMTKECIDNVNCPVDGSWSSWVPWSYCDKDCGMGKQTRNRSCTKPKPSFGGKSCVGKNLDSSPCMIREKDKCDDIQGGSGSNTGSGSGDGTGATQIISGSGSGSGSGDESSGILGEGSGNIKSITDADVESGDVDDQNAVKTTARPMIIGSISTIASKVISGNGEGKGPFIDDEDDNKSGSGIANSGSGEGSATDKDKFFVIKP